MGLSIKIGHRSFRVLSMSRTMRSKTGFVGQIDFTNNTILLCPRECPEEQARILLHELLHGCYELAGSRHATLEEEDVAMMLDGPLTTILADNPHLFAVLHQALAQGRKIVGGSEEPGKPQRAPSPFLGSPVASPLPPRARLH